MPCDRPPRGCAAVCSGMPPRSPSTRPARCGSTLGADRHWQIWQCCCQMKRSWCHHGPPLVRIVGSAAGVEFCCCSLQRFPKASAACTDPLHVVGPGRCLGVWLLHVFAWRRLEDCCALRCCLGMRGDAWVVCGSGRGLTSVPGRERCALCVYWGQKKWPSPNLKTYWLKTNTRQGSHPVSSSYYHI